MMKPRPIDVDKVRSEERHSLGTFLKLYNEALPPEFPRASRSLLALYQQSYIGQFKDDGLWSLDAHRKKFMDWLPLYLKSLQPRR